MQWILKKWQLFLKKTNWCLCTSGYFIQNKNSKQCCSVLNWQNRTQCRYIHTQRDSQKIQSHQLNSEYWHSTRCRHTYWQTDADTNTHPADKTNCGMWKDPSKPSIITLICFHLSGQHRSIWGSEEVGFRQWSKKVEVQRQQNNKPSRWYNDPWTKFLVKREKKRSVLHFDCCLWQQTQV